MDLYSQQSIQREARQKMQPEIEGGSAFVWRYDLLFAIQYFEDRQQNLLKVYQLQNRSLSHPCFQKQSYHGISDNCFQITRLQNCDRIILFRQECLQDNS